MNALQTFPDVDDLMDRKQLRNLLYSIPPNALAIVLGSWARGTAVPRWSDIDVLVIGDNRPPRPGDRVQVIFVTLPEFTARVKAGDDFVQWALRYGVPLAGSPSWKRLVNELLSTAPWPDPRVKLQQAQKRLSTAVDLLDVGDVPAAEEEFRYALSHAARAKLLARKVFPLSRQELPNQLADLGEPGLADLLRRVNSSVPMTKSAIRRAMASLSQLLPELEEPA